MTMGGIERLERTDWRVEYVAACKSTPDAADDETTTTAEPMNDSSIGVLSFKLHSDGETPDAPERTRTFECEMDDVGVRALTDAIDAAAARIEALKRAND